MNIHEGKLLKVVIFYFQTLYMSNNSVKDMSEFGKLVSLTLNAPIATKVVCFLVC